MKKIFKIILKMLLSILLMVMLVLIGSSIYHHKEIRHDKAEYAEFLEKDFKAIESNFGKFRYLDIGEGEVTLVYRGGLTTPSFSLDFLPLARELSQNYRILIIEPLGYNLSDQPSEKRTLDQINREFNSVVNLLAQNEKIVLINHSISALYSLDYVKEYPENIVGIINIDGSRVSIADKAPESSKHLTPMLINKVGFLRLILSNQKLTDFYGFTYMLESMSDKYDEELKKQIINVNKWAYWQQSMIGYLEEASVNTYQVKDEHYPNDMPVLSLVASKTLRQDSDWIEGQKQVFSNTAIQAVKVVDGEHYLHHTSTDEVLAEINRFMRENSQS
ncbi:alpha/beta hydrolase [Facklamia sp. DSM 111018]|uniref:Alpha/beta hydrolase n=1 Tax=Facklamia lactis TaxID=2749967 RepID=A0ABS0LN80_9LACT|nr:alpha/beta hydrolase [Facklamia lactis]MBG9979717.1 alpha/beta hydrolase [Facklamia lactis]MBG9985603.1 alpha/beta hydrolase [Facklamia lactis]